MTVLVKRCNLYLEDNHYDEEDDHLNPVSQANGLLPDFKGEPVRLSLTDVVSFVKSGRKLSILLVTSLVLAEEIVA